jgi:hypothetical protein
MNGEDVVGKFIEVDADPETLYRVSLEMRFGDGVPILPATDERVDSLLAGTPLSPDDVVGVLPPRNGALTVRLAAVNAAMAGVAPEAFPLVLAALEGVVAPEFNAFALTTTTSSVFPMLIVNGPTRDALGIDYRAGCLGGASGRGSMTIGRALSLCLRNVGGQRAGETSRSVFGQPARFGLCFGEWEERSPWPSLAERRGFSRSHEVVTVHGGKGTFPMADIHNDDARDLIRLIAKTISFPLNNWYLEASGDNGQLVLCLNPIWARRFGQDFPHVSDFQEYLWSHAWQPIELWPAPNQQILQDRGRVDTRDRVFLASRPDQLVPVVCGGLGSLHAVALTSFCQSDMQSVSARRLEPTVRREL